MGMSPSADLFWGYDLGDLTDRETYDSLQPQWLEDGRSEDEVLAAALGWVEVPYPSHLAEQPDRRETDEYRAWSANRDLMRATIAGVPVEFDRYGYSEEPCYCVRVKASVQRADDYGSTELQPLVVDESWAEQIAVYMRLMQLPVPDVDPGWHMNCSYG